MLPPLVAGVAEPKSPMKLLGRPETVVGGWAKMKRLPPIAAAAMAASTRDLTEAEMRLSMRATSLGRLPGSEQPDAEDPAFEWDRALRRRRGNQSARRSSTMARGTPMTIVGQCSRVQT
jgi:hypothetical protein